MQLNAIQQGAVNAAKADKKTPLEEKIRRLKALGIDESTVLHELGEPIDSIFDRLFGGLRPRDVT